MLYPISLLLSMICSILFISGIEKEKKLLKEITDHPERYSMINRKCPMCSSEDLRYEIRTTAAGATTYSADMPILGRTYFTNMHQGKFNFAICNSCGNNWTYLTQADAVSIVKSQTKRKSILLIFLMIFFYAASKIFK